MRTVTSLKELSDTGQYGLNAAALKEGHGVRFIRITDIDSTGRLAGAIPAYVDPNINDLAKYELSPGDLLIARSGATAGKSVLFEGLNERAVFAGYLIRFRPRIDLVLPEYLGYYLQSNAYWQFIKKTSRAVAQPNVNARELASLPVPLVSLSGQRRIVDLLSRAENIARMRREAEQKTKEIIPALFLDVFGDPATNPKGWPSASIDEIAAIQSPLRTPDADTEASAICIGPDSIESMTGQLISQPTVGEVRPISGKYRYRQGDVLYSKIRPALVKVALAPSDGYCSADMYPLRCTSRVLPQYLLYALLHEHFTRYALDRATRAQMPKINREALFAFRLPVPSLNLQESFARHCRDYECLRQQQRYAAVRADQAFQSLLDRAFGLR